MITATNATTFTAAVQHGLTRAPIVTLGGKDAGKFAPNINMGFSFKGEREERSDGNCYELDLVEDRKSVDTITIYSDTVRG